MVAIRLVLFGVGVGALLMALAISWPLNALDGIPRMVDLSTSDHAVTVFGRDGIPVLRIDNRPVDDVLQRYREIHDDVDAELARWRSSGYQPPIDPALYHRAVERLREEAVAARAEITRLQTPAH